MAEVSQVTRTIRHPLRLRVIEVKTVERITPRMARITFGGADLEGFVSLAPEDHVKLFFPEKGGLDPVLPEFDRNGLKRPANGAPPLIARDYTPRKYDPARNELVIDFLLHGEDGVASAWASRAGCGMKLGLAGPRGSHLLAREFDWYLLAGDETALPAIARRLEEFPVGTQVRAVILVSAESERQSLPERSEYTVQWVERPQSLRTGSELADALASLPLPPGEGYAWVAGEVGQVRAAQAYLLHQCGLPREHIHLSGHWRRGTVNYDHHTPIDA